MKRKNRVGNKQFSLSTLLLLAGVMLIAAGGSAYLSQYPWRQHLYRLGWAEMPTDLPDPPSLPVELLGAAGEENQPGQWAPDVFGDPVSPGAGRPALSLTWLGTLKLPRIGIAENIVEGAGDEMLYAVGHVPGSAAIGGQGNCVLAAHRNYVHMNPFRHLDKMEPGDRVLVGDGERDYTYEIFAVFEVEPGESRVLEAQQEQSHMLTLLTCTPVVNPTKRLIVWCRLVDVQPA